MGRRLEKVERFCHEQAATNATKLRPIESAAQAINSADIVITLTLADTPVIQPGMLSPGRFLCSMGETEEVEIGVLKAADRFIVDAFDYATLTGDIAQWLKQGFTTREQLEQRVDGHIGQVASGQRPGRQTDTERIYAIIRGMGSAISPLLIPG